MELTEVNETRSVCSCGFNDTLFQLQRSRTDVSNFDSEFTNEPPKLTPTDKLFIMNLDQTEFTGFSYVNPEFVITV